MTMIHWTRIAATVVLSLVLAVFVSWHWIWLAPAFWLSFGIYELINTSIRSFQERNLIRILMLQCFLWGIALSIPAGIVSVVMVLLEA